MNGGWPGDREVITARCRNHRMNEITPERLMEEADRLYAYAMQRTRDHHRAEDLVQDCLLVAWRKRDSFDGRSQLGTWLTGIMKFKVLDHFRASRRTPTDRPARSVDDEWGADPLDHLFDVHGAWKVDPNFGVAPPGESPGDLAHRRDLLDWVLACMEHLPERLRLLFSLREIDDLPVSEAAAAAGVTPGSAAVLLTRARHQLRACLQRHQIER